MKSSRAIAISEMTYAMKNSARALSAALGKKQKGVAEANALLKGSSVMIDATFKLPPNSSAASGRSVSLPAEVSLAHGR